MNELTMEQRHRWSTASWLTLFFGARLILLISLPEGAIRSYGDYWNFYHQASLGIPFWNYWTEFPPVFPFIAYVVNQLSGGKTHIFDSLLYIIFTIFKSYLYKNNKEKTRYFCREDKKVINKATVFL